mmetsp:Transcript_538/g.812  ORF Transcript_538/g.812 Transcript_538/m.812 type:complete len:307 (-) Transcript_538:5-925(-)
MTMTLYKITATVIKAIAFVIVISASRVDGFILVSDTCLFQRQPHGRTFLGFPSSLTEPKYRFGDVVIPPHATANDDLDNRSEDQEYKEFQQIFAFAKQRASPELEQEYVKRLELEGQSWYDRPDLQEEFILKVEMEQLERMVELEQTIQQTLPDIYQSYVSKAQQEKQSSLLTTSPNNSDTYSFSLAQERPDLMIRMEQEYTIWQVMENQIKEFAPDLYQEVHDELVSEQQKQQQQQDSKSSLSAPPPLSSVLMGRNDLLQKVNSKVNQLRKNVEDITQAVTKKPKNRRGKAGVTNKAKKGFGFGK